MSSNATIITDDNIYTLVELYLVNKKNQLPNDLQNKAIGDWDVSRVTDMSSLFYNFGDTRFNESINNWNVSEVTNMENMFYNCRNFNQPLYKWNVGKVTNMSHMFYNCSQFNQPINSWNVSNVIDIDEIFVNCPIEQQNKPQFSVNYDTTTITDDNIYTLVDLYVFNKVKLPIDLQNKPIGDWDVSRVTYMRGLFNFNNTDNNTFNESLNNWDVSNVTDMVEMFADCKEFNQPLNNWNVSNVTTMSFMFSECTRFNQPINNWDVSNVMKMKGMFYNCRNFNQPLNNWNVSNVTKMSDMFRDCISFNQPLDNWDVHNVMDMSFMFNGCTRFNQPINNWNIADGTDIEGMFYLCNIVRRNKPNFVLDNEDGVFDIDARQIHKAAAKINYPLLISVLKEKVNKPIPVNINYSNYINTTILELVNTSEETEKIKNTQRQGLERIMRERLNNLNYQSLSPLTRESIFYVLEYVKLQSLTFKNMYVDTFIKDCVQAYEGPEGMSCAPGVLERIIYSFVPACAAEETDDCKEITGIIEADPNKLIPQYIIDWYKEHKTGTPGAFPEGTTSEQFKQSLTNYLKEKMPIHQFPDIEDLIQQKVEETTEYVGFEPDDFMRGGKKRKMKKKTIKKVRKTNKKRNKTNKKVRKTNKKINKKVKKHTHRHQIYIRK